MTMKPLDLSVIICCYNTRELVRASIQSVVDTTKIVSYEIIVIDDCSSDQTDEMVRHDFPQARLIRNSENLRFVKNVNLGLTECGGRYGLLLDSDTVVQPGAFDTLVKFMDDHPDAAAGGPKLINYDGSIQHCIRGFAGFSAMVWQTLNLHLVWPSNPLTESYYNTKFAYDFAKPVPSIGTSSYIIRRSTWENFGLFDDRFTLAFCDLAYNHKLTTNGQNVYIIPEAVVLHYGSQSISQNGVKEIHRQHDALGVFYDNYVGKNDGLLKKSFVRACIKMRRMIKLIEYKISRDKRVMRGPGTPKNLYDSAKTD